MEKADMKVVRFMANDVIATSGVWYNGTRLVEGEYLLTGMSDGEYDNAQFVNYKNEEQNYFSSSYDFNAQDVRYLGNDLGDYDEEVEDFVNGIYTYEGNGIFTKRTQ